MQISKTEMRASVLLPNSFMRVPLIDPGSNVLSGIKAGLLTYTLSLSTRWRLNSQRSISRLPDPQASVARYIEIPIASLFSRIQVVCKKDVGGRLHSFSKWSKVLQVRFAGYLVPVRKSPIFEILNGLGHQMLG